MKQKEADHILMDLEYEKELQMMEIARKINELSSQKLQKKNEIYEDFRKKRYNLNLRILALRAEIVELYDGDPMREKKIQEQKALGIEIMKERNEMHKRLGELAEYSNAKTLEFDEETHKLNSSYKKRRLEVVKQIETNTESE